MIAMDDPCAFSPGAKHARQIAAFFASMYAPGSTILDIGFGQGFFLDAAARVGVNAIGLDRDERLVSAASKRGLRAIHGEVESFDYSTLGVPVDGVMMSHLVEHLTPGSVATIFDKLATEMRSGAIVIIVTPNMADLRVATQWFWMDPTHLRPYPAFAVRALASEASWLWEAQGYEPIPFTRRTPLTWLNRARFGSDYGRSGCWYRLRTR